MHLAHITRPTGASALLWHAGDQYVPASPTLIGAEETFDSTDEDASLQCIEHQINDHDCAATGRSTTCGYDRCGDDVPFSCSTKGYCVCDMGGSGFGKYSGAVCQTEPVVCCSSICPERCAALGGHDRMCTGDVGGCGGECSSGLQGTCDCVC